MARFTDIFDDVTKQGRKIPTNEYLERGMHPIIDQGQKEIAGYSNEEAGLFCDVPAIIFGDHTRVIKYVDTPCFLGADGVKLLKAKKSNANYKYLFYALSSADIPNTGYNRHFKWLKEVEIPTHTENEQNDIVAVLDKVSGLIALRKQQLQKLDELVKARFVEMFGDPETNPNGWEQVTVGDVCSSIVRGPFGSALKKDFFVEPSNSTYKVYEQKHAIQKSATIGTYYITEEKYQELKRFECLSGDIIMSCSGTMGELYQLPERCERGIINQALCKFTLNNKMLPICFLTYMRQTIGNLETKGSGIKNIAAVSYVKAMPINLPPMSVQIEFESFCKQTDKSKVAVQKALDASQLLFDSLMQKYFG